MRTGYVYGLRDPDTGALRYVGKTLFTPQARLNGHMLGAMNGSTMRVARWIRELGVEPRITVFAAGVPEAQLADVEAGWIRDMRAAGYDLLNSTVRREVTHA